MPGDRYIVIEDVLYNVVNYRAPRAGFIAKMLFVLFRRAPRMSYSFVRVDDHGPLDECDTPINSVVAAVCYTRAMCKTALVFLLFTTCLVFGNGTARAADSSPDAPAIDYSTPGVVSVQAPDYIPGSWTLAVLPDPQLYSRRYPGLFLAQTGWIANHAADYHIEYVFTLGDLTNNNTPGEWRNARDAFRLLDGCVPYTLVTGNHDYGPNGNASSRETLLNDYFDYSEHTGQPCFGGAYEVGRLDNSYHLFSAGGVDWIVLCLEWGPRDEVVAWAGGVLDDHPDRRGILLTHAYMYHDDTRIDFTKPRETEDYNPHDYRTPGTVNDGRELWDKLVRGHDVPLVLSGHILGDGTGYRVDANDAGTPVYQILANYQMRELGGEGYLRLLEFQPGGRVQVKTYSPLYDAYLLSADQQFNFTLE